MSQVDSKLQIFEEMVMQEANQKKLAIENEMEQKKQEALEVFELQILEKAYNAIQKEKAVAIRKKNEMVSKVLSESRKALLSEREKMVEDIFSNVFQKLEVFKKSEEYKQYLLQNANEAMVKAGEGEIAILLDSSDEPLSDWLSKAIGKEVLVDSVKTQGGCRAFNKTKNVIFDNSLTSKIAQEKELFLEQAKLSIV